MWVKRSQDLIPGEIKFTYTYSSFHTHTQNILEANIKYKQLLFTSDINIRKSTKDIIFVLKMIFNNQTDIKYNLRKFILSCNYPPKFQEENKLLHTKKTVSFFFSLFKCDNNVPSLFLLPNFVIFLFFFLSLFFFKF